jgi:hypothetical protein
MIREIDHLQADPDDFTLDVERVVGAPEWRWRFKGPGRAGVDPDRALAAAVGHARATAALAGRTRSD